MPTFCHHFDLMNYYYIKEKILESEFENISENFQKPHFDFQSKKKK